MEEEEQEMTTSLRARRRRSSVGISCCFNGGATSTASRHRRRASFDGSASSSSSPTANSPRLIMSPSTWIKNDFPEIKGKCRSFISRMAHTRRHSSSDLSYDPLSYALNFEDDDGGGDDFQAMNFTARLPASPPTATAFDHHHHLPRTPIRVGAPKLAAATGSTDELKRGFEALEIKVAEQRRDQMSSPRAAAVAEVMRSLEEVAEPVGISSKREILVQLA